MRSAPGGTGLRKPLLVLVRLRKRKLTGKTGHVFFAFEKDRRGLVIGAVHRTEPVR